MKKLKIGCFSVAGVFILLILLLKIIEQNENATVDEDNFMEKLRQERLQHEKWEKEHPKSTEKIKREAREEQERMRKNNAEWNKKFYDMDYGSRKKIDPNTTKKIEEYTPDEYWDLKTNGLKVDKNGNPIK